MLSVNKDTLFFLIYKMYFLYAPALKIIKAAKKLRTEEFFHQAVGFENKFIFLHLLNLLFTYLWILEN